MAETDVTVDLANFFGREGISLYSEVCVTDLGEKDQAYIRRFFSPARAVIIFGRPVPVEAYHSTPREQTDVMLGIAGALDEVAIRLAARLQAAGIAARPIPLYLPVAITDGVVHGVVRLKHVATAGGLGTIGKNTLLLNPIHGPRLLLSGVVLGRALDPNSEKVITRNF